ncbi:MAG TPA: tetratricopeptide repeat protein, partial [Ktedonobacteraceae bacterium]
DDICEHCGAVLSGMPQPVLQTSTASSQASFVPPVTSAPVLDACPKCGQQRTPGKGFCNRCGYKYPSSPDNDNAQTTPAPDPSPSLKAGSILHNKYKIVKAIASGGMGAVYLAEDTVLKRNVVIKALLSDTDPDLVAQSVKEREFLATIKHANIVSIYDFITIGTSGYIVMEYVHGKTLDEIMEEQGRPFTVEEALRHIIAILPAFTYLAKLNLVYCDFKPQNVMLEVLKDGSQIVKLIDLGTVIKHVPHPDDVYGTHGFYAPEAVKSPSSQTDLYTICRTLAYLVSMMDLANPIFGMPSSESYKAFRDYPALYRLLAKGTHTTPARRFHSAEELSDQLSGVLRLVVGSAPGVLISSRQFISGSMTTTGKLGLRGEAALDESDGAIVLLRVGDQALRSGNLTNALRLYKQASNANRRSVDASLRMAEIYIEQGNYSSALAEIISVQRFAPGNWKVPWYMGRLLEAQGKLTEAADQYRELMMELPGELPPQQALARVYALQGNYPASVDLYAVVLKADSSNTEAILGMTRSLIELKRWDEATKILGQVGEATARYIESQLLLCDIYLSKIEPLTHRNVIHAAEALQTLTGRTEDARYFLARAEVYRAAWQLARKNSFAHDAVVAGVADTQARTLRMAAEANYIQYLRREPHPPEREKIVRRKLQVAPWRFL